MYVYIVKHNYTVLGGMLFTLRKAQLHVSALNVGHITEDTLIPQVYTHHDKKE